MNSHCLDCDRPLPQKDSGRVLLAALLSLSLLAFGSRSVTAQPANPEMLRSSPDRSRSASTSLEMTAQFTDLPGNLTVTPTGRMIVSLHPFAKPQYRVVELLPNGQTVPFPDRQWASGRQPNSNLGLDEVLGLQSDLNGVVWLLDNGGRTGATPQLVGWDSRLSRLHRIIALPRPLSSDRSFLNDLAIDSPRQIAYLAETALGSTPALLVVNLKTGQVRRVLAGHRSVMPEDVEVVVDGKPVQIRQPNGQLIRPRVGVNPIALDTNNAWLYYGPMNGKRMYRVSTQDLRNERLSPEQLAARVEDYAAKPNSDGMAIDQAGNLYVTDIENQAIGVIRPDRSYFRLVQDPLLNWVNDLSFGADGGLYAIVNQLHKTAMLNGGQETTQPPFFVVKLKPLAPGTVGR